MLGRAVRVPGGVGGAGFMWCWQWEELSRILYIIPSRGSRDFIQYCGWGFEEVSVLHQVLSREHFQLKTKIGIAQNLLNRFSLHSLEERIY